MNWTKLDSREDYRLNFNDVELQKWERELITIKRVRADSKCNGCDLNIKSGCFAFGGKRTRFCINCAKTKYLPMVINRFDEITKEVKKIMKNLENKKAKYEMENTLAMLK